MLSTAVIIPTRNRPCLLARALESIFCQTRQPEQIIIVTDGGDEPTPLPPDFPLDNITLLTNTVTLEAAASRNRGAYANNCDILMFLDDDDQWCPTKIEDQLSVFSSDTSIGLVYSGRLIRSIDRPDQILRRACSQRSGDLWPDILKENLVGITSSVAIRSRVFHAIGGFDTKLQCRQDYDLWIRASKKTAIAWDGHYNVYYTVWPGANDQISKRSELHADAAQYLISKYHADLTSLSKADRNKALSEKWYSVAKANRPAQLTKTLYYLLKSQWYYTNLRRLAILAPRIFLKKAGLN